MENGVTKFPMDSATYKKLVKSLGENRGQQVSDKLYYLSSTYDTLGTDGIVDRNGVYMYDFLYSSDDVEEVDHSVNISCEYSAFACTIPKGYTSYRIVGHDYSSEGFSFETKSDTMFITMDYMLNNKRVEDLISIPVNTLKEMDKAGKVSSPTFYGKNICFYMTNLSCDLEEDNINLRGVLFIK